MNQNGSQAIGSESNDGLGGVKFTKEDLDACWPYFEDYLLEIMNGEYDISVAREDLRSLIGTKFDNRVLRA